MDGEDQDIVVSKIFENREFGFAKMVVERPLRLNFAASPDRIERLHEQSAFKALAESKKRKDGKSKTREEQEGREAQHAIVKALQKLNPDRLYRNREEFVADMEAVLESAGIKPKAPIKKAMLNALAARDETAEICIDVDGNREPDPELRDTENVPLPAGIRLPIGDDDLPKLKKPCEEYLAREVLPHVPDAWIDHSKTKVGYEIPLTRHFYQYQPPRPLHEIETDIKALEADIVAMLSQITS